ncbi:hypothetical protein M3Y97_00899100 [Aphelenchoides bicaudatus]|nr:hypothetical protein M3Y97_00899100 [Aphelenchoides bicaudatus]
MTTEQDTDVAPNEEKSAEFLMPKVPVKKQPNSDQPKVKSAINKLHSLIPPSTDSYVVPSWAELPESSDHVIEVMDNGVISARHKLKELAKKSYITIGRMDTCDIEASIPGASRIHCYLQFGDGFEGRGWYLYDPASTQGTFVNKKEVPKKVYYRCRAGSIIRITKSNFQLFLDGTDQQAVKAKPAEETQSKSPEPNFLDELKAKTERSFEKDPFSMLSKFCEREGLEFKFTKLAGDEKEKKKEKGVGITYAFDLPDDICSGNGGSFSGTGTDARSAQSNCALQVCRHLNELNLLNYDVQRGASKNIQDNDFYEEDEDTFYDRTGQLEIQRQKRIDRHKASIGVKEKALTYPQLLEKINQLETNQQAISEQLHRLVKPAEGVKVLPEELDVSNLNASLSVRLEISKLKRKYEQLSGEIKLMNKAAEIAKPFDMKLPGDSANQALFVPEPTFEVEVDESIVEKPSHSTYRYEPQNYVPKKVAEPKVVKEPEVSKASTSDERELRGPAMPPSEKPKPASKPGEKKFGLLTRKDLQAQKNLALNKRKAEEEYFDEDEVIDEKRNKTDEFEDPSDVADWVPPKGQSGDGRTALNDKYGY